MLGLTMTDLIEDYLLLLLLLPVGMRDFAVVAAFVITVGLPTIASHPAVAFGVVEMATSAGLAKCFNHTA